MFEIAVVLLSREVWVECRNTRSIAFRVDSSNYRLFQPDYRMALYIRCQYWVINMERRIVTSMTEGTIENKYRYL
jgi:hypothetical protein